MSALPEMLPIAEQDYLTLPLRDVYERVDFTGEM
jgi:hypothetical protein